MRSGTDDVEYLSIFRVEHGMNDFKCMPPSDLANLAHAYAEQIDDIGQILVRAKVITEADIARDGVRFAVRNAFDPPTGYPREK